MSDDFTTWWDSVKAISPISEEQARYVFDCARKIGREAGMREASELVGAEAARLGPLGNEHPADSPSRDRCFARARTAEYIRDAILSAIDHA